jgi:hypothetical protein
MFLVPHTILLDTIMLTVLGSWWVQKVCTSHVTMTQQRTPPPLSLSESAGLGDLLDDLPRSWFTADGPTFLPCRTLILSQKIVRCSDLKTLLFSERPRMSSHSFTAKMRRSRRLFILCEGRADICITKLQMQEQNLCLEEHPYYINYIVWWCFGCIRQRSEFDLRSYVCKPY